jgi:hypothetical protein
MPSGNLWATMIFADRLVAITPEGELLELLDDGDPVATANFERLFAAGASGCVRGAHAMRGEDLPLAREPDFWRPRPADAVPGWIARDLDTLGAKPGGGAADGALVKADPWVLVVANNGAHAPGMKYIGHERFIVARILFSQS